MSTARPALSTVLDQVHWLPGAGDLLREVRAELPQHAQLCGAFTGLAALRALTGSTVDGLQQRDVALLAGTRITLPGDRPAGEGGADPRRGLPVAADRRSSGTSAAGVRDAVLRLSGERLAVVPASGAWHGESLLALLAQVRALPAVAVIANVATREFVRHDAGAGELAAYLETGELPEPSSWRVGHFTLLGGTLAGPAGTLVAVLDTYRSLGVDGVHLQPAERVAAALRRDGLPPGGVLLVVSEQDGPAAERAVRAAGLDVAIWDNGTPYAPGARR